MTKEVIIYVVSSLVVFFFLLKCKTFIKELGYKWIREYRQIKYKNIKNILCPSKLPTIPEAYCPDSSWWDMMIFYTWKRKHLGSDLNFPKTTDDAARPLKHQCSLMFQWRAINYCQMASVNKPPSKGEQTWLAQGT